MKMYGEGIAVLGGYRYRSLRRRYSILENDGQFSALIAGKRVHFDLNQSEYDVQAFEFHKLVLEDCYKIRNLHGIRKVVDVGANLGFFSLHCVDLFPDVEVDCYEPNPDVYEQLVKNTYAYRINALNSAVQKESGKVALNFNENSLHTTTSTNVDGSVDAIAFSDILDQHNSIDVLKLDCEGAEWEILDPNLDWSKVRFVTMEFHTWAKKGSSYEEIADLLQRCGFRVTCVDQVKGNSFGMLCASRANKN